MTLGSSRSIPCKSGMLTIANGALELRAHAVPEMRIETIALHDIMTVECVPDLVSCSLRIMGRDDHKLFADGVLFGDTIQLIMLLGYTRVRSAQDTPQPDAITVTSLDGRHRLVLVRDTLTYTGQLFWELPLTSVTSIQADSAGARSTLLFGTVDGRACATDELQSSGTVRLLLAMADVLGEQPTTILDSTAIIQSAENGSTAGSQHVTSHPVEQVTRATRLSRKNRRRASHPRPSQR